MEILFYAMARVLRWEPVFVTPLTFHYIKFKEAYLLTEPINGSKLLVDHHWMIFRWCTFEFICLNVGVIIEGIYLIFCCKQWRATQRDFKMAQFCTRNQKPEIRNQKPETGNQKPERTSTIWNYLTSPSSVWDSKKVCLPWVLCLYNSTWDHLK